ncbi:hypothetical protein OPQ81_004258 [Rhizoctonia solani]|nr:hypothetical protein OPQ81_004258 [Rhizoctonia solani]
MTTFNGEDESLLLDLDGKKLDDVEMGEKVVRLWQAGRALHALHFSAHSYSQSFGKEALFIKNSGSGSVSTIMRVTAMNMGVCIEDLSRVTNGVASISTVIEAATTNQGLMGGIIDSMLDPEFNLD